jgi:hypothetical protein
MILVDPIWRTPLPRKDPRLCFVIMPFREKWSDYIYREYIKPIVESQGLVVKRSDKMFGRNVLDDIWSAIYSSRMIIADVSAPNENVFYELGVAHALGKKTIILSQNITRVPFDLRTQRIVLYSDDHPGYKKLKEEIPKHVRAILDEPIDEVHHVHSILGGYKVLQAKETIELFGDKLQHAHITDWMKIIGVRENVVILNKVVEIEGRYSHVWCNRRCVHSDRYPNELSIAVMFEEPYIQIGTEDQVEIKYLVEDSFKKEAKLWPYNIAVDCDELIFNLITPATYSGTVHIVKIVKPTDYVIQTLSPIASNGKISFTGKVKPDLGTIYAIKWT